MSNPYQAFFDKLDATIPELSKQPEQYAQDAVDLLQRAGFVLGSLINAQSQVYPMLFLPAENPEPATEDTDTPSLDQQADPSADARSDGQTPGTGPGDPQNPDSEVHSTT